jgi:hypothetical protein
MKDTLVSPRGLRWVKTSAEAAGLSLFPDFLILGPQRTGTSWLYSALSRHPQIFLTEPKETYFFSALKYRQPERFVTDDLRWYLRHFRDPPLRYAAKCVRSVWRFREFYAPKMRGEATASYAALDYDVIEEITRLNPRIKAILMVRNPIDRAWSHAKKDLLRGDRCRLENLSKETLHGFLLRPYQISCGRYTEQLGNWTRVLSPGYLFVGRFDDIVARPRGLLLDIMRFLGVRAEERYIDASVDVPVNVTAKLDMPESVRRLLTGLFTDELRNLEARLGFTWPAIKDPAAAEF